MVIFNCEKFSNYVAKHVALNPGNEEDLKLLKNLIKLIFVYFFYPSNEAIINYHKGNENIKLKLKLLI